MGQSDEPRAKASGVATFFEVIAQMLGAERSASLLARLPPDTQSIWTSPPLPTSWVPDLHIGRVLRALDDEFDEGEFEELGRRQMQRDMSTTYRVLVKLATPKTLAKRAPLIWSTYTENGRMRAELSGERELSVWPEGVTDRGPSFWAYQRGTIARVFEYTRARAITCELVEGGGTQGFARYRLTWK